MAQEQVMWWLMLSPRTNKRFINIEEPDMTTKVKHFDTGAVRGEEATHARFDLITPIGLQRLALTCGEGAVKYGDENWLKGIDCRNLMNHAMTHLNQYMAGDTSEDHLAHAAWNIFAIMHNEAKMPHMQNITTRNSVDHIRALATMDRDSAMPEYQEFKPQSHLPKQMELPFDE